ncbi:MAG: hypothetical protein P4N41_14035 [Negativicutes bacterium]|nr:hypothetical protein [Negativicutes bacterium]
MDIIDELKTLWNNISECVKYLRDVPLFFTNGKAYFVKIHRESLARNIYRLSIYFIVFSLIQISLLSVKSKSLVVDNQFEVVGRLFLLLPIVSLGYYLALMITDIKQRIRVCINYVLFQDLITVTIPILFLTAFICSENYFFYYVYSFVCGVFILYKLLWFVFLFNKTMIKRIASIVIILLTIGTFSFFGYIIDIKSNKSMLLFEDAIASEFLMLGCMDDIQAFIMNQDVKETLDLTSEITCKLRGGIENGETTFIFEEGTFTKLANYWNLIKVKEYEYANRSIKLLTKKQNKAIFERNKSLINKNIELYKSYIDFLDEYDIGIRGLSNVDYKMLYKYIDYKKQGKVEITKENIIEVKELIKDKSTVINNIEKYIQAQTIIQNATNKNLSIIQNDLDLTKQAIAYYKFILQLRERLPVYIINITPLEEYELEPLR